METIPEIEKPQVEICSVELYKTSFHLVARYVSKMGGTFDDAKDILHDAFIIYRENTSLNTFHLEQEPEAYILGIAKKLWIRKFNSEKNSVSLDSFESEISLPSDIYPAIITKRLLMLLETTGKKCLELLHAFYYERLSVQDIQDRFGFRSEHSASVQKYKCIEKMRDTVQQKSIPYESFFE